MKYAVTLALTIRSTVQVEGESYEQAIAAAHNYLFEGAECVVVAIQQLPEAHAFTGRSDRPCTICGMPDRSPIHFSKKGNPL